MINFESTLFNFINRSTIPRKKKKERKKERKKRTNKNYHAKNFVPIIRRIVTQIPIFFPQTAGFPSPSINLSFV